jgi:F-type H+-transporting ATPase subunit a
VNNAILVASANDIDFMIHGLFSYELFGQTVWITTSHVCIAIVMLVIIILAIIANRTMAKATAVPGKLQNVFEIVVSFLDGIVTSSMGKSAPKFRNYIGTIFIFILLSNISGIFGLRPPTADYGTTFALGVMTFLIIHFNQFKHNSLKSIWVDMCSPLPPWLPIWLPINLITMWTPIISTSLRMFGNCLAGSVVIGLVNWGMKNISYNVFSFMGGDYTGPAGIWFAPIFIGVLNLYFALFSGYIQTLVFASLSAVWIGQEIPEENPMGTNRQVLRGEKVQ